MAGHIYDHAAPVIRQNLCEAVHAAHSTTVNRDKQAYFATAYAFAKALEIMSLSKDTDLAPGIVNLSHLVQHGLLRETREFLGPNADLILGEQS